jgi:hypothetical protein
MRRIHRRILGGGATASLILGAGFVQAPVASAAEYRVSDEAGLREAVAQANAEPGPDTIRLATSITLTTSGVEADGPEAGDLDVTDELRVVGGGEAIDGGGLDRIFDVSADGALEIEDLVLRNGAPAAGDGGGAIRSLGTVRVLDSLLHDNTVAGAGASGGAILNEAGRLEVLASRLRDNAAERAGGAIEADRGVTIVRDSVLVGNSTGAAPGNGGALHLTGAGRVNVFDTGIVKNTAASEGGGLWNSADGTMNVRRSALSDNVARGDAADNGGGGLFNDGGSMLLRNSVVADNAATGDAGSGGGVFNNGGELTAIGATLSSNRARRAGGGVEALAGTTDLTRSTLLRNHTGAAPGNGGGLHLTGEGSVSFVDGDVVANRASSEGGGLWNSATGTMTVTDSRLRRNVARGAAADNGGGALFNDGGEMRVQRSRIVNNSATGAAGSGGGILNDLGSLVVARTVLKKNDAPRAGGGVETNGGFVAMTRVRLLRNTTGANPGNGGGFHTTGDGQVSYVGGRVVGNSAAFQGGGLWNSATGTMTVSEVDVRRNEAQRRPNLYNDGGTFTFDGEPVRVG